MKIIFIIVVLIFLSLLGPLLYLGGFKNIVPSELEIPGMNLVYVKNIGSYYEVGPVMNKVYEDLKAVGIESTVGAGIYLDNPQKTPKQELRSLVGSIVSDNDALKAKEANFSILKIKTGKGVMAEFPYKNILSYMLAPMKIYPEMQKYLEKNEIVPEGSLELYDVPNKKIQIFFELETSYVDEAMRTLEE